MMAGGEDSRRRLSSAFKTASFLASAPLPGEPSDWRCMLVGERKGKGRGERKRRPVERE